MTFSIQKAGRPVIHCAASSMWSRLTLVNKLTAAGASLFAVNNQVRTVNCQIDVSSMPLINACKILLPDIAIIVSHRLYHERL